MKSIYLEETRAEARSKKIRGVVLIVSILVAATASHLTAAFVGHELAMTNVSLAAIRKAQEPRRAMAMPAEAPTRWACTKVEAAEYREACYRRALNALVKPNDNRRP